MFGISAIELLIGLICCSVIFVVVVGIVVYGISRPRDNQKHDH